jgi:PAS domain S-box-containing protein
MPSPLSRFVRRPLVAVSPLLAAAALAQVAAPPPAPRVLRAGVELNSQPFTFADDRGRPTGFAVELLQAVARDQKLNIEYVALPWTELLDAFKAGRLDLICNVVDTPDRRAYIDFSATTIVMRGGAYVRRSARPITTVADLAGLRVATPRQSRAHEYLKNKDWKLTFVFPANLRECIEAVHDGRADFFVATRLVTDFQLRESGHRDIVAAPLEFPEFDYREHFGVQPGRPDLLARLNDGLLSVQRNGTYDRLHEKWIGPLQPRPLGWRELLLYVLPLAAVTLGILLALLWQRRLLRRVRDHAEALRASQEQLSLVLEGSQDGFWDWDIPADRITRSPRWAAIIGYALEELPPTRAAFTALVHPDDLPRIREDEQLVWRGKDQFSLEFRMRAKSGEWRWVLDRGKVVARDPHSGLPLRIAGTHTDITARKQAEEESEKLQRKMLETQKLESLGVLAGGIAHDFNNLLTVILGHTSFLYSTRPPGFDADTADRLGKVVAASHRAADLCRQLLAYAGKGAFLIEKLDLNRLVQDTSRLLELSPGASQLVFTLAPDLPPIEADASQIRQIIMNLVLNASEAIGSRPGGHIQVTTRTVRLRAGEPPDARPAGGLPEGDYVCVEVADNGGGMTAEVLARIFDPFFTTKFTGRGLGLAAVLGIVRAHQGALTVRSTPGQGSTFNIYLPAAAGSAVATPVATTVTPFPAKRATGTILVADDEESVRHLVSDILRRIGYEAVLAADGAEALELFRTAPNRFRAVMLDITMPKLDGLTVLQRCREVRPRLPGLIFSGHSEQDARGRFGGGNDTVFLQKPFSPESLLDHLLLVTKDA